MLVRVRPMLDHYRFSRGLSHLKHELALTRRLARTANADIDFHIEQKKGGLICLRKTDEPLTLPRLFDLPISIPHLRVKEGATLITFTGTGWIKKEVKLTLFFKDKTESLTYSNLQFPPSP